MNLTKFNGKCHYSLAKVRKKSIPIKYEEDASERRTHSSRMRTARLLTRREVPSWHSPFTASPFTEPLFTAAPAWHPLSWNSPACYPSLHGPHPYMAPPPPARGQTPLKTLPSRNFVCSGHEQLLGLTDTSKAFRLWGLN